MRSFRTVLTVLFWGFALFPMFWLSVNQLQTTKRQELEFSRQQLMLEVNHKLAKLRTSLEQSFYSLDKIASDGSIITSSMTDFMSVKVTNKLQKFLVNNPNFNNIMILDNTLFKIEAQPNQALALDISPFINDIHAIFNDEKSITDPNVRILVVPDNNNAANKLFAAARPILRPKESLINPFEVTGVLFTTLPLEIFINRLLDTIGSSQQSQISLYQHQQLIYQNKPMKVTANHISYQARFSIGNNAPFTIKITQDLSSKLTLLALLFKEKNRLILSLTLLLSILFAARFIIKRLILPINDLKRLTQKIAQIDWYSSESLTFSTSAHYKEFHELKVLLHSMLQTIQQQFTRLSNNNDKLTSLTEALRTSVKQSDKHNEILQNLIHYDLNIRKQEDINHIACLTLGIAFKILSEPIGLVIYRSDHQSGFTSIDRANLKFLQDIAQQHQNKVYLTLDEINHLNQTNTHYHLTAINVENYCLGYIVTPNISPDSFTAHSIEIFLTSLQSRLQELQLKNELSKLANTDALTGLYNRHFFEQTLKQLTKRFTLEQQHFAIMVIDINDLKHVNDNLGHEAGDQLIQTIAHFIRKNLRASDTIARIGGDEFVILIEQVDGNYCHSLATKLMQDIKQQPFHYQGISIELSFSCGFASTHQDPVNQLFDLADQRMYQTKQQKKSSVHSAHFPPS